MVSVLLERRECESEDQLRGWKAILVRGGSSRFPLSPTSGRLGSVAGLRRSNYSYNGHQSGLAVRITWHLEQAATIARFH